MATVNRQIPIHTRKIHSKVYYDKILQTITDPPNITYTEKVISLKFRFGIF